MVRRYELDGVVAMLIASCRSTAFMYHKWRRLKEALKTAGLNVPTLGIEADMVDSRTYSDAAIKDQIRAFMETVEAAHEERQAA
jgi:benzoyl-CoA reductase/2-hydroxyglutaryl-CoA dehydratase subunit BcrC/BadD/HgdB